MLSIALLCITIILMEHLANYKGDIFPNDNDIILIDANKAVIWGRSDPMELPSDHFSSVIFTLKTSSQLVVCFLDNFPPV